MALLALSHAARPQAPPLALALNIPAFRLEVREWGGEPWTIRVAVGMPKYPTPRGDFEVSAVEWNPWWIPPDSPWAAREKVTPPGPSNPMGRVKLHFRPLYFLHGTPWPRSIGTAGSHGCVRLSNDDAIRLGRAVVRAGAPGVSDSLLEAMIADSTHTRTVPLTVRVPLVVRYELVEVRGGRLLVHRDIYGLGPPPTVAQVLGVLAGAGWDTSVVDTMRVRALLRRARTRGGGAGAGAGVGADSLRAARPGSPSLDDQVNDCIIQ
ncbi:MAG TPA: L,D-transpeptidase [Gemmatimonadaceae bacterium]